MKFLITILFYLSNANANDLADPVMAFDSMEHENPGCPINSECSPNSGKSILIWESFIKKSNEKSKVKELTAYLKKTGLPIDFLTKKEAKISLDPIMWNSRCSIHNPKNEYQNVFKGRKFLKQIPKSEHMIFTPIISYNGKVETEYRIPYQDQPIMIKNKKLITIKDYDDFYYHLGISKSGQLTIENISTKIINMALDKRVTDIKCPGKMEVDKTYFSKSYCQKIYNFDQKKLTIIQYAWSCP